MAFEAEVCLFFTIFPILQVNVHNPTSALDGSNCVPLSISKTLDRAGWKSQRAFGYVDWGVVSLENVFKIPDVDELFWVGGHHQWEVSAHLVYWLAKPRFSYLLKLNIGGLALHLPELDEAVPAARCQTHLAILLERIHILYRRCVLSNHWRLLLWIARVPQFDCPIRVSDENRTRFTASHLQASEPKTRVLLLASFLKAYTENRSLSLCPRDKVDNGRLYLGAITGVGVVLILVSLHVKDLQFSVPATGSQDVPPLSRTCIKFLQDDLRNWVRKLMLYINFLLLILVYLHSVLQLPLIIHRPTCSSKTLWCTLTPKKRVLSISGAWLSTEPSKLPLSPIPTEWTLLIETLRHSRCPKALADWTTETLGGTTCICRSGTESLRGAPAPLSLVILTSKHNYF